MRQEDDNKIQKRGEEEDSSKGKPEDEERMGWEGNVKGKNMHRVARTFNASGLSQEEETEQKAYLVRRCPRLRARTSRGPAK
mmetsp:Transcript_44464/g.90763  ORF Transcript_44464/g.90763 Transcript_44464/m.90763 type:complete len:82 (-) Transcript_44464:920-1165(-)